MSVGVTAAAAAAAASAVEEAAMASADACAAAGRGCTSTGLALDPHHHQRSAPSVHRVGASLLPPLPLRHASTACPPLVASQLGLTDAVLGEMQRSMDASNGMSGDTFPAGLPCFLRHTIEPADKTMDGGSHCRRGQRC